ncbi:SCO3374 family protein [Streptomyces sp. NPDC049970]|uniref:SCO3374 family protein n=1 Tax=Streptomyces sp. NPDC049970 TaxID=3155033 RepID=UPI00344AE80C
MASLVPPPRSSPESDDWARWYARELGWATAGTSPLRLLTGLHFDVLELSAAAGHAALGRVGRTGPVVVAGQRMRFLVAAGGADELPGLLEWLEWGGITLDLTATGAGGHTTAPAPPGGSAAGPPGAALWLRPPGPRQEVEQSLPTLGGFGSRGGHAPDLVRLVDAAATECHRARLTHARTQPLTHRPTGQPLAFS